MWEGRNAFERGHRIVAKGGEIPQHPVPVNPALALHISQHRIQGKRIPMYIRKERQKHRHLLRALGKDTSFSCMVPLCITGNSEQPLVQGAEAIRRLLTEMMQVGMVQLGASLWSQESPTDTRQART
jgi:hypothetical protein